MFVYIQLEDHCGLSGLHRRGSLSRHFLVRSCESKSTPPLKPQCPEAPTPEKDPALLAIPQLDSYIYMCVYMHASRTTSISRSYELWLQLLFSTGSTFVLRGWPHRKH